MALKVVHIKRKKLEADAETQAFWENVLKPKWEERARLRGEKLKADLVRNREALVLKRVIQKEAIKAGETLKIVIEVEGNNLNIRYSNQE